MPDVSIVVSTYNRASMLPEALHSALRQQHVDLEVIVVDNGSTDETGRVLAEFDDPRLRVIRNEHTLGGTGGRNTGLAAAKGDWVGILDDDDLWAPDKVVSQLSAMESDGSLWSFAGVVYIDGDRRVLGGKPPPTSQEAVASLPWRFTVPGGMSNTVWRRDKLDGDGLLDPNLFFAVDWDLVLRLSRIGMPAVVSRPLVAYRQHGSNASRKAREYQHELDKLEEKHADLRQGRPIDRGVQERFLGSEALRAGERKAAIASYIRGWRLGDWGCLVRSAGVLLPQSIQGRARRRLLSDRAWQEEARRWLHALDRPAASS